jgi:predicted nucleic-acid-binding Zn-ribbon protein
MDEGTCPSCGGTEIYASRNGIVVGETYLVALRRNVPLDFRGSAQNHQTDGFWAYVCAACGLIEYRLLDVAAIDWVRQNWSRVTTTS